MPAYIPTHAARDASQNYGRPGTSEKRAVSSGATYIPTHMSKDSKLSLRPGKGKKVTAQVVTQLTPQSKPAAYVPKHAASDHARITTVTTTRPSAKMAKMDLDHPLLETVGILPSGTFKTSNAAFNSEKLTEHIPVYDSSDYENFLQAYRVAMTRVTMARKTSTTIEMRPIRDISISTDHRMSITSMSSHAPTRRGSSASIMEKIGAYIKPPRPDSTYSFGSEATSPIESRRGSFLTLDDRSRWSRSSVSTTEVSKDRDAIAIEKAVRDAWNVDGSRRSRIMPVSPGLKRFNQTHSVRT